jgi:hypothetical protein
MAPRDIEELSSRILIFHRHINSFRISIHLLRAQRRINRDK